MLKNNFFYKIQIGGFSASRFANVFLILKAVKRAPGFWGRRFKTFFFVNDENKLECFCPWAHITRNDILAKASFANLISES
jgi:hypothetical protein